VKLQAYERGGIVFAKDIKKWLADKQEEKKGKRKKTNAWADWKGGQPTRKDARRRGGEDVPGYSGECPVQGQRTSWKISNENPLKAKEGGEIAAIIGK